MTEISDGINCCAGMAPRWAEEIRHPDLHSTEFWRRIAGVRSADFNEDVTAGLVQNGPGAIEQVSVAGIRFTQPEAQEVAAALATALGLIGGADGLRTYQLAPAPGQWSVGPNLDEDDVRGDVGAVTATSTARDIARACVQGNLEAVDPEVIATAASELDQCGTFGHATA